ncbi:MAG: ribosomal protein S18-alanine N-acetyltransferase [bacterium]|jgi:ribosomal-protein-alanine N-acetyltransferase
MKEEQDQKEKTGCTESEQDTLPGAVMLLGRAGFKPAPAACVGAIELLIRPISVHDLEQILEIEEASYRTPWTSSDFLREITYNQLAYYFLVEAGERIAGFIGMWLVVDEAHITNIAVSPDFRRQGVGEKLLLFALEIAGHHGARCAILEVRVSNARALNLYLKHGFRYIGLRKAYYRDNDEDAFLMEVKI